MLTTLRYFFLVSGWHLWHLGLFFHHKILRVSPFQSFFLAFSSPTVGKERVGDLLCLSDPSDFHWFSLFFLFPTWLPSEIGIRLSPTPKVVKMSRAHPRSIDPSSLTLYFLARISIGKASFFYRAFSTLRYRLFFFSSPVLCLIRIPLLQGLIQSDTC